MKFDKLANRGNERPSGPPPHIAAKRCAKLVVSAVETARDAVEKANSLLDLVGIDEVLGSLSKDEADELVDALDALAKFSNANKSAEAPELDPKAKKADARRVHP